MLGDRAFTGRHRDYSGYTLSYLDGAILGRPERLRAVEDLRWPGIDRADWRSDPLGTDLPLQEKSS